MSSKLVWRTPSIQSCILILLQTNSFGLVSLKNDGQCWSSARCVAKSHCMCRAREFLHGEAIAEKTGSISSLNKWASQFQSLLSIRTTWLHKSGLHLLCSLFWLSSMISTACGRNDESGSGTICENIKIMLSTMLSGYTWYLFTSTLLISYCSWFLSESNASSWFKSQDLNTNLWKMTAQSAVPLWFVAVWHHKGLLPRALRKQAPACRWRQAASSNESNTLSTCLDDISVKKNNNSNNNHRRKFRN